jgi:hypothetical protein
MFPAQGELREEQRKTREKLLMLMKRTEQLQQMKKQKSLENEF